MSKEKIERFRFKLHRLLVVKDEIDVETAKKVGRNAESPIYNTLEVGFRIEADKDFLFVLVTWTVGENEDKPFVALSLENTYQVSNLAKSIRGEGENLEFKNKQFLFFLVDHSISHLRAIQFVKLSAIMDNIPFLPFRPASNIMQEKNQETGETFSGMM